MDDGAPRPVLLESMEIDADGRADLEDVLCDQIQDDVWNICDYVQFHVWAKLLQSSISCIHVFLGQVILRPTEGLQWDAQKLRDQIVAALLRLQHCCAGPYSRRAHLTDGIPWGLVNDAAELRSFAEPDLLAINRYLGWFVQLLFQKVSSDVVGL